MTTETPEAPIFRLTAEIERLQQVCGRWQTNSIETWSAMQAMRNDINVHVPMPSMEGDLLQGPESSVFCAAVAESVVTGIERLTSERDAALARESALRAVLQPFSDRADAYDPEEDDDHHFDWSRDSGQITLGQLRNARAALAVKL